MKNKTILWADDDADDIQMMHEILAKHGKDYQLVEVPNGKEALDYLESAKARNELPCLIILDINMPVLDGKKTLSVIKQTESFSDIPVVMFTTSNSELDRIFCTKLGTEMITKPPEYKTLQTTVLRLLELCA